MIPRLSRVDAEPEDAERWGTERVWFVRADGAREWSPSLLVALSGLWHYWLRWLRG